MTPQQNDIIASLYEAVGDDDDVHALDDALALILTLTDDENIVTPIKLIQRTRALIRANRPISEQ